jgi:hypothetical protein
MNPPSGYGGGVVTPHASFLALRYAPDAALTNLERLARPGAVRGAPISRAGPTWSI